MRQIKAEPLFGEAMEFVLATLPDVRRMAVLEVGCGRGETCTLFALKEATAIGVDADIEVLHDACRNALRSHFVQGLAESLPLPDNCVDAVFSRSTLQYMDRPRALREFQRVLRPGGSMVLIENLPLNPIILMYRLGRRLLSRQERSREYVRSIRGYVTIREIESLGNSFGSVQLRFYHLTRMLSLYRPALVPAFVDKLLARTDRFILTHMASARMLAWFVAAVYIDLRKPKTQALLPREREKVPRSGG
jgi:SAM-dependent methyltransferase